MCNPITFDGCFGWYHQGSADLGVVLCASHGHEELCAHRHWRALAHNLAARGLPVLRFDYPGTGDSGEDDDTPGRVQAWIQSIHNAGAALRAASGVERIALVGLRIGAPLALAAAEEMSDLAAVALLAPLTSGESCVRELRVLTMMAAKKRHHGMQASTRIGSLEPAGFLYTKETLEDLRALPLLRSGRRLAESILLLDRPNTTPDQDFRARIRESGAEFEEGIFEDYPLLLRDAGLSSYPDVGFGRLIDWLAARARPAAARSSEVALSSVLALPDSNETPAVFDDDPASFGVLCTPHGVAAARPTLVFLNTGANHHIGMGRMTVTMARRLAAIGFTSFRFDIGGIGDSDPPPDRSHNHPINPAMVADVRRALDWLQSQGHSEFILIGVCSGGKLALHTTIQDKRVVGQMLLNLQGFWKPADPANQYLSRRAYVRLALRAATWKRVLRGDTNVRGIVKSVIGRAVARVSADVQESLSRFRKQPGKRGAGIAEFRRLAARRVRTHFVYVEEDPGLDELEMMFGRDGRILAEVPHVSMTFEREGDHVFSSERARRRLFAEVEQAAIRMALPPVPEITLRPRSPEPENSPSTAPSL